MPSPLKSPTATLWGLIPTATGDPEAGANPPLPSPNRMLTVKITVIHHRQIRDAVPIEVTCRNPNGTTYPPQTATPEPARTRHCRLPAESSHYH